MEIPASQLSLSARNCFREPIPEIAVAAQLLDAAVTAHLQNDRGQAERLIRQANMPEIREWGYSIWGAKSPYVQYQGKLGLEPTVPRSQRQALRMPTEAEKSELLRRDGYHCRFCGIPVIRSKIRQRFAKFYPTLAIWGKKNDQQHAAFQTMWVQYDHILPHARGGNNDLSNLVIACAPCNYGRMNYTLEEVNLADPRSRSPVASHWDGLERFG
jgi:hypothetical protein